jgi:N-methylhydantoinase A
MSAETVIGVDIGGTFTDFVVVRPGVRALETFKLLSTPGDPAQAVLLGLERVLKSAGDADPPRLQVIHGSTVATNALLERKGAVTALVATRGFGDLLQIGRQNRPELYDFAAASPLPLVVEELRFEVDERVDARGQVLQALDLAQVEALLAQLQALKVEAVAICLLFSFLRPEHELLIAAKLRQAGFFVSPSCEILPEYREYERASTAAVNAYVSPVLDRYLEKLEGTRLETASGVIPIQLRIMQSNGGNLRAAQARREGVRCILSGPAGGVVGAGRVAQLALDAQQMRAGPGAPLRIITFDMGGTSTDVSLIDGAPRITNEAVISGCPIRIPMLDIHTIGAGGGSIAYVDAGGALRVGPQSAGADPGPACYGKGELPTVTDANLVLGRLSARHFLGGQMPLDEVRARLALARLGRQAGLDAVQAALGVVAVVNAHMERALRVISVERGYDPRDFTLLSFGGAGGLHAAGLARRLGIPRLLVPPLASTLSAFGMLAAEVIKDYSQTVMLDGQTPLSEIAARLEPMAAAGLAEVQAEGIDPADIRIEAAVDMRYRGQSYELTVPFSREESDTPPHIFAFHALHQQAYGYARPDAPIEIVTLRLRAIGRVRPPDLPRLSPASTDPSAALLERRRVLLASGPAMLPVYRGEALLPANYIPGPALVLRSDTSILLDEADSAIVDLYGNLLITIHSTSPDPEGPGGL